jgi:hypothetical protein
LAVWTFLLSILVVGITPTLFLPSPITGFLSLIASVFVWFCVLLLLDRYLRVPCAICGSAKLIENIPANSPAGAGWGDEGIEHRCPDCGAFFIDYRIVEEDES